MAEDVLEADDQQGEDAADGQHPQIIGTGEEHPVDRQGQCAGRERKPDASR
jgi:hypothetical protein